jgi:type I restriction enzyme M protein
VDSSEAPEQYDIYATMFGGIPHSEIDLLEEYWKAIPTLRRELFETASDKPYSTLITDDVAATIAKNNDTVDLCKRFDKAFQGFADELHHRLISNVTTAKELKERYEIADDIFERNKGIPLVDRYAAYQALSNEWQTIANDIETLQTEGMEAARKVETAYKLVKKGDEEIEVADGLKGRIIPFAMVQETLFEAELQAISAKEARNEEIDTEVDELRDSFTEEEAQEYLDGDDDPKLDKAKIKKDAKAKGDEIEPETKAKLVKLVKLWEEQTKVKKEIKEAKAELIDKTKEAIEHLTDEEVELFLHKKWIDPVVAGINDTLTDVLKAVETRVTALANKYAVSYKELGEQMAEAKQQMADLVADLTGDEYALEGLRNLN